MTGRPTQYTPELAAAICERMMAGESVRAICESPGMPGKAAVYRWIHSNREFAEQFELAKQVRCYCWAEETIEIADDSSSDKYTDADGVERVDHENINRSRLRVDTRKWFLARILPKQYGDKVEMNHGVADNVAELLRQIDGTTRGIPTATQPPGRLALAAEQYLLDHRQGRAEGSVSDELGPGNPVQ